MLTFFSVPKAFEGDAADTQRNAIRSWKYLGPACQVIICGDEAGCREIVSEFELDHISNVDMNDFGTPLLSSVFERAEQRATHDRLCYVNCDLILFSDFLDAIGRIGAAWTRYLVVGERTHLDVEGELVEESDLQAVRRRALISGIVRGRKAIDFFVFSRDSIGRLPDFAVGRPYWDQWMIWNARKLRMPVVDISPSTVVVHQKHGYGHVRHSTGPKWQGPEMDRNRQLLGAPEHRFTLDDATHRLTETGLVPNRRGIMHRVGSEMRLHRGTIRLYRVLRRSYQVLRGILSRD